MRITGSPEAIAKAKQLVTEVLSRGGGSVGGAPMARHNENEENEKKDERPGVVRRVAAVADRGDPEHGPLGAQAAEALADKDQEGVFDRLKRCTPFIG